MLVDKNVQIKLRKMLAKGNSADTKNVINIYQVVAQEHHNLVAAHEEELHSHLLVADNLVADHSLVVVVPAAHIHQAVHIDLVVADHSCPTQYTCRKVNKW